MPRSLKPDDLKTGSGKRVPEKGTTVSLTGAGMVGAGPNIGQEAWMSPAGAVPLPRWVRAKLNASGIAAEVIQAHVDQSKGAHKASAISLDGFPTDILPDNVEDAFDEVVGVLPPVPPLLGGHAVWTTFSGITDWGNLKTDDRGVVARGLAPVVQGSQLDAAIYPYYWKDPSPLIDSINDSPFAASGGQDPTTDDFWNSDLVASQMYGAGQGGFFAGAFTRDGTALNDAVVRTTLAGYRQTLIDTVTALPLKSEVTLSGSIFPADRGVLALVHWPAGAKGGVSDVAAYLGQSLSDRCIAALLIGQGITGQDCVGSGDCDDLDACDGDAGGIFSVGVADGNYNPYAFPGRASGQYDLGEIHNHINDLDSQDLNEPFTGGVGVAPKRTQNGTVPAAGQVRLGTDPNAVEVDPTGYGIPVLGGGQFAYTPAVVTVANVDAPRIGHIVLGNSIVRMEDPSGPGAYLADTNFFRYRLPYLKDYTPDGLKWTPSGAATGSTLEKFRFFGVAQPVSAAAPGSLVTAGNYGSPFDEDYFTWQIARYRHSFLMPSTTASGVEEEAGNYWLIHFKKEADFEAFVRDGVMPWDATNGYDTYGAQTLDTADPVEGSANLVNEVVAGAAFTSPDGPAPDYGYVAPSYFARRSNIILDSLALTPTYSGTFDWANLLGYPNGTMYVSGVASFIARRQDTGASNITITDLNVAETTTVFFNRIFRTDDSWLLGDNLVAPGSDDPALLSSPAPAMVTWHCFGYGAHPAPPADQPNGPSLTFPLDADTNLGLSDPNSPQLPSRVEIPFTHCGPTGAGHYSDANGPQTGQSITVTLGAGAADIAIQGDALTPSFSELAQPRGFFRRPLGHLAVASSVEPFVAADGHGVPITETDNEKIFLHTTSWNAAGAGVLGNYGNFTSGAVPSAAPAPLFTALKDTEERFLDESYRWQTSFQRDAGDPDQIDALVYGIAGRQNLTGPGMGGYVGGGIEVPVRAGNSLAYANEWAYQAWIPTASHTFDLNTFGNATPNRADTLPELQVKGWPNRNPPLTDRVSNPYPSSGLLIYPQRDYRFGTDPLIRPNNASDAVPGDQPNYTTPTAESSYVRCFDAGFAASATVQAAGQPFVIIRIDGVNLADFSYAAPGPGSLARVDGNANTYLAIMVKVPGLTTWMDMGRADGAGPSKQDALLDGAGCQVPGPDSISGVDPVSGLVFAQVKCNVGPVANLFAATGIAGAPIGEVPVLVKVIMRATAKSFNMESEFDGTDFIGTVAGPGMTYGRLRGIAGIKIVDPTI